MNCPCNHLRNYEECCGKIHRSIFNAQTAEELMRSRYSAFVLDKMDYLKLSHANSTVHTFNLKSVSKWTKTVKWVKLEILFSKKGKKKNYSGYVEFKAYYEENTILNHIHGKSRFIKQDQHWVYLDEL